MDQPAEGGEQGEILIDRLEDDVEGGALHEHADAVEHKTHEADAE